MPVTLGLKHLFIGIWLLLLLALGWYWWQNPAAFRPENIAHFIETNCSSLWLGFVIVSLVRGLFLIPNTPIVIVGAMLFPEDPFWVIGISLLGILFSGSIVYHLHHLTGVRTYFERHHPKQLALWERRLSKKGGFAFVVGWSLFPLVPTDLLCYAAGVVGIPYRYLFTGVLIGEAVLVSCLVYTGSELFHWLVA
ncbi:MAG: VTT domain-containing protein [Bacteroidota bacterium]